MVCSVVRLRCAELGRARRCRVTLGVDLIGLSHPRAGPSSFDNEEGNTIIQPYEHNSGIYTSPTFRHDTREQYPAAKSLQMSGDSAAPTTNGTVTASLSPELDVTKLQSLPQEQQDLYLLTFATSLSKHVQSLDADECTAQQTSIKKELTTILNLTAPPPTRVIRNTLGRCYAHVLGKGDRRLLFETVNELITSIAVGKNKTEAELRTKHAATHCLGEIFAAAGDSAPISMHYPFKAIEASTKRCRTTGCHF